MALAYNITTVLDIENANANINALTPETLNAENYEMAFFGVANFLSGDYTQNTTDVNDIKSNLVVNLGPLNNAHFFYVADVNASANDYPGGKISAYGANITETGTIYGSAAVTNVQTSNNNANHLGINVSDLSYFGTEFIAMTSVGLGSAESVVNSVQKKLLNGSSSAGDALFQAVTAALFKKLGKNAALLNDTDMVADLNTKFRNTLNTEIGEDETDYANSKYFKRYLASGRYKPENNDINRVVTYNVDNTVVNMVIKISGHVQDIHGGPDFTSNTAAITKIFGTSGTDHKISVTTSPNTVGEYDIKVFVQLRHDPRF